MGNRRVPQHAGGAAGSASLNGPSDAKASSIEPRRSIGILRLIAILKFVKATLLIGVGLGALRLLDPDMAAGAQQWAAALATSSDRQLVQRLVERAVSLPPARLETLGIGAFLYAGLFATEGIGLWGGRRWAEYFTTIATGSFIPFEAYELVQQVTVVRASALALNVAVVAYLIVHLKHSRSA
jgi:uncharacterized membrane protein (DUF2068 family)